MCSLVFRVLIVLRSYSTAMQSGAQSSAPHWTPLCGVDQVSHGSTVVPDPVGTRRWSSPTVSGHQSMSQHSAVGADACGVRVDPLCASSNSFPFSTPVASAAFPSMPFGSFVPPVRANVLPSFAPMGSSGGGVGFMSSPVPFQLDSVSAGRPICRHGGVAGPTHPLTGEPHSCVLVNLLWVACSCLLPFCFLRVSLSFFDFGLHV